MSTLFSVVRGSLLIASGALTLASASLTAQGATATPKPERITFDDAISIALRQNNALQQAENTASLGEAEVASRKSAFLPSLSLSTSSAQTVGRSFSQTEGSVLTQTTQSVNVGLQSSVTLFDGMRNVSELRQARLDVTASTNDVTRAKQSTVFTVSSNFLTLMTAQADLAVQQGNLASQQAQQDQLQKLVAAGARPVSDLYTQQATTASAQSAVVTADHNVELAKIALIQTLQLDPRAMYDFVAPAIPDVTTAPKTFQLDSLLTRAFVSRADLAADATRVDAAVQGTKAANAGRLPTVSLSAGYNTAYNSATALSLGDQLDQRRGGSLSLGVSIPLFDKGATGIAVQEARIQEDNARLSLEAKKQAVALEVRKAYLDYESTRQQLAAAMAQQKAADLAVSTTLARYQIGSSTLLELTQARASQVQAATAVASAKYTLAFQQRLMSYYTGDLNPGAPVLGS